jgi:spore photoproduct lyase
MKRIIENNYPDSKLTYKEMVAGDDNKIRYVKPIRLKMYRLLYNTLKSVAKDKSFIYFCMERWDIWTKIMGQCPDSIAHLDYLFAKSLYERYKLTDTLPERKLYELSEIVVPS